MKRGTLLKRAVIPGLLVAAGIAAWVHQSKRWMSPLGVPRDFRDTEFFTAAETTLPSPRALRSSEVVRKEADGKIFYVWQDTRKRWLRTFAGRVPPRFYDDDRQVVNLTGGGQFRIAWAQMGYNPARRGDISVKEKFAPTWVTVRGDSWEPLDENAFQALQIEVCGKAGWATKSISSWWPGELSLDLAIIHEGMPNLGSFGKTAVMNLDTMTALESLGGGYFTPHGPNLLLEGFPVEVFYPARLAVGFDVGYGSVEEIRLPISPGSRAKTSALEIEIVATHRAAWSSAVNGALLGSKGSREERAVVFKLDETRKPRTDVLFSLSPPELGRFCEFALVDRTGKEQTIRHRVNALLTYLSTETLPDDLAELVVRYRPNHARIIFELPPLRGVPAENRHIDNLFDVVVPHLEADEAWNLEWAISTQAGVRFGISDAEFPDDYFPRRYENVTLGELLDEYLQHHPDGDQVRLDRSNFYLRIPEPFSFEEFWQDARARLGI